MKILPALASALILSLPLAAHATSADDTPLAQWQSAPDTVFDAASIDIDAFKWTARPVIIFADSPLDPAFQTQLDNLFAEIEEAVERDIVIITDTRPDDPSDLRQELRPRGFQMVLIGKDGGVKLRKPFPWDMRELSRTIDKMPMRQREISEARGG
ncbi:MAG: DUF4174 domain-containing protein [Pseudomonadota bacterium]